MKSRTPRAFRLLGFLLPLAALAGAAPRATAQHNSASLPVSPYVNPPVVTGVFDPASSYTDSDTGIDYNYYNFTITGFSNTGSSRNYYRIDSFSNDTLEHLPGVVGVSPGFLPPRWTFIDVPDFNIRTVGIYPDDPQYQLIFEQTAGTTPINPTGAPFMFYQNADSGESAPFTDEDGSAFQVTVNDPPAPAPEPSSVATVGIVALFTAGLVLRARKRRA